MIYNVTGIATETPSPELESETEVVDFDTDRTMSFEEFGETFLRKVLHLDRVLTSIEQILGDEISFGPIGAGPGRKIATVKVVGKFGHCYGETVPGHAVAYRVNIPIDAQFDINLRVDVQHFRAKLIVPITVILRPVAPLTIVWDLIRPTEDELEIEVTSSERRAQVLQRLAGLDGELRRFLLRIVDRELDKPHVRRARRIELISAIDGAWQPIASQFLPSGPEDRGR